MPPAWPFAVTGEIECLQAERGEGGEATEQPNHDELAHGRACEDAAVGPGQRCEEADYERAHHFTNRVPQGKVSPKMRAAMPVHQYRATPPIALPTAIQQ